ncbi:MAG: LPS assembly lipoprotein LptE [Limnohabitans sp.]
MQRRCLLSLGVVAAAFTGCGFQLRQTGDYPFKSLYTTFASASPGPFGEELRRQLKATGRIELLTEAKQAQQADVILDILQDQRRRVVVGTNASGQVRELQLRMTVRFRLRTPQGVEWIEPVELFQQRDLSFNETAALSKEIEEASLYREMQNDIIQQIMRRLARVKPPAVQ